MLKVIVISLYVVFKKVGTYNARMHNQIKDFQRFLSLTFFNCINIFFNFHVNLKLSTCRVKDLELFSLDYFCQLLRL